MVGQVWPLSSILFQFATTQYEGYIVLFHFSKQLPELGPGSLKVVLSRNGALRGPSASPCMFFRNYRYTRTPSVELQWGDRAPSTALKTTYTNLGCVFE